MGGLGYEMTTRLDGPKDTKQVHQHDATSQLRHVIQTVNLPTVYWYAREQNDLVEIHAEIGVDIVDESFDVLL